VASAAHAQLGSLLAGLGPGGAQIAALLQSGMLGGAAQAAVAYAPASRQAGAVPDGSWVCLSCQNTNFPQRTTCNAKNCGRQRHEVDGGPPQAQAVDIRPQGRGSDPPGSWGCHACGNVNWPQRTTCNKKGCGLPRTDTAS